MRLISFFNSVFVITMLISCAKGGPGPVGASSSIKEAGNTGSGGGSVADQVQKEASQYSSAVDTSKSTDPKLDSAAKDASTNSNGLNSSGAANQANNAANNGMNQLNQQVATAVLNNCGGSKSGGATSGHPGSGDNEGSTGTTETCPTSNDSAKLAEIITGVIGGMALLSAIGAYLKRDYFGWNGIAADRTNMTKSAKQPLNSARTALKALLDPATADRAALKGILEFDSSTADDKILDNLTDPKKYGLITATDLTAIDVQARDSSKKDTFAAEEAHQAQRFFSDPKLPSAGDFANFLMHVDPNVKIPVAPNPVRIRDIPQGIKDYLGISDIDPEAEIKNMSGLTERITALAAVRAAQFHWQENTLLRILKFGGDQVVHKITVPNPKGGLFFYDPWEIPSGRIDEIDNFKLEFIENSKVNPLLTSLVKDDLIKKYADRVIEQATNIQPTAKDGLKAFFKLDSNERAAIIAAIPSGNHEFFRSYQDVRIFMIGQFNGFIEPADRIKNANAGGNGKILGELAFDQKFKARNDAVTKVKIRAIVAMAEDANKKSAVDELIKSLDDPLRTAIRDAVDKAVAENADQKKYTDYKTIKDKLASFDRNSKIAAGGGIAAGIGLIGAAVGMAVSHPTGGANLALTSDSSTKTNKYEGLTYDQQHALFLYSMGQIYLNSPEFCPGCKDQPAATDATTGSGFGN